MGDNADEDEDVECCCVAVVVVVVVAVVDGVAVAGDFSKIFKWVDLIVANIL
jgi:hypothetical protein